MVAPKLYYHFDCSPVFASFVLRQTFMTNYFEVPYLLIKRTILRGNQKTHRRKSSAIQGNKTKQLLEGKKIAWNLGGEEIHSGKQERENQERVRSPRRSSPEEYLSGQRGTNRYNSYSQKRTNSPIDWNTDYLYNEPSKSAYNIQKLNQMLPHKSAGRNTDHRVDHFEFPPKDCHQIPTCTCNKVHIRMLLKRTKPASQSLGIHGDSALHFLHRTLQLGFSIAM